MTRAKKSDVPWVVMNLKTHLTECLRCGNTEAVPLPMPLSAASKFFEYLMEKHRFCPEKVATS